MKEIKATMKTTSDGHTSIETNPVTTAVAVERPLNQAAQSRADDDSSTVKQVLYVMSPSQSCLLLLLFVKKIVRETKAREIERIVSLLSFVILSCYRWMIIIDLHCAHKQIILKLTKQNAYTFQFAPMYLFILAGFHLAFVFIDPSASSYPALYCYVVVVVVVAFDSNFGFVFFGLVYV